MSGLDAPSVIDDLVAAVDRLFVAELRAGLADEQTLELVAKLRELEAAWVVAACSG